MIRAFVGRNGAGKSLGAVVFDVVPALLEGRPVVSSVPIHHPLYQPLESWRQLAGLSGCLLFLDEISSLFPSRQSNSVPPELVRKLEQLRKSDVRVVWTAPAWARADSVLRAVTLEVVESRGFWPDHFVRAPGSVSLRHPLGEKVSRSETDWPSRRLFRYRAFSAVDFVSFTNATADRLKPEWSRWYFRPWGDEARLYSTLDPVSLLDSVDEVGTCVRCGGRRSRPVCKCGVRE